MNRRRSGRLFWVLEDLRLLMEVWEPCMLCRYLTFTWRMVRLWRTTKLSMWRLGKILRRWYWEIYLRLLSSKTWKSSCPVMSTTHCWESMELLMYLVPRREQHRTNWSFWINTWKGQLSSCWWQSRNQSIRMRTSQSWQDRQEQELREAWWLQFLRALTSHRLPVGWSSWTLLAVWRSRFRTMT